MCGLIHLSKNPRRLVDYPAFRTGASAGASGEWIDVSLAGITKVERGKLYFTEQGTSR
jgi:hypothetical protein